MKPCHFCRAHLGEFLDGTLSPSEREKVAAHLETCPDCAREKREFELTMATLHDLKPVAAPPELRLKVRAALQDEREAQRSGRDALDFRWWRPARMALTGSVTLAAVLLFVLAKPFSNAPQFQPGRSVIPSAEDDRSTDDATAPASASKLSQSAPSKTSAQPLSKKPTKKGAIAAPKLARPSGGAKAANSPFLAERATEDGGEDARRLAPTRATRPAFQPRSASPLPAVSLPTVPTRPSASTRRDTVSASPVGSAPPAPIAAPKEGSVLALPKISSSGSSVHVFTAPAPQSPVLDAAKPTLRFRAATPDAEPAAAPAPVVGLNDSTAGAFGGGAQRGLTVEIAALDAPVPGGQQHMAGAMVMRAIPVPAPPVVAESTTGLKSAGAGRAGFAAKMAKSREAGGKGDETPKAADQDTVTESRAATLPKAIVPAAPAPALVPNTAIVPIVPNQRRYHLSVTASRDVQDAQITLILPPSLRFGTGENGNSRVAWRGDVSQGKKVEFDVTVTGAQGGEKIGVQLEQNGAKAQSEPVETQIIALPTSN